MAHLKDGKVTLPNSTQGPRPEQITLKGVTTRSEKTKLRTQKMLSFPKVVNWTQMHKWAAAGGHSETWAAIDSKKEKNGHGSSNIITLRLVCVVDCEGCC